MLTYNATERFLKGVEFIRDAMACPYQYTIKYITIVVVISVTSEIGHTINVT